NTGKDGTHPAGVGGRAHHAEHDPRKVAGLYAPRVWTGKDPEKVGYRNDPRAFADKDLGKVGYRSRPRVFADKDGWHPAHAAWPQALTSKAPEKDGDVLRAPRWLAGKDPGKVALVDWQLPLLIYLFGNTIIMWPHVLAGRPTGYMAEVLPRRP